MAEIKFKRTVRVGTDAMVIVNEQREKIQADQQPGRKIIRVQAQGFNRGSVEISYSESYVSKLPPTVQISFQPENKENGR